MNPSSCSNFLGVFLYGVKRPWLLIQRRLWPWINTNRGWSVICISVTVKLEKEYGNTFFFTLSKCNLSSCSLKMWLKTSHNVAATTYAEITTCLIIHHQPTMQPSTYLLSLNDIFPGFTCNSRRRRSLDLEQEKITLSKTPLQLCFKISSTVKNA